MLPPIATLVEPVSCYPAWHTTYKKYGGRLLGVVNSGCVKDANGNVPCNPADMARVAGQKLGTDVSLEAYTLARYLATEVGNGTVEEKVAVAQAAVNRAKYVEKLPRGILDLLLYRQRPGHPNYGWYGPIHGPGGVTTAPYGRWAATSKDPTYGDIILAMALVDGVFDGFNKGADDQDGMEYTSAFPDPARTVRERGAKRRYWVGPLPGVDHWRTFLWRSAPEVAPDSELGRYLIARGVAAVSDRSRPKWTFLPVCGTSRTRALMPAIATFLGVGLASFVAIGVLGRKGGLVEGPADDWWRGKRERKERLCYRTKTAALQAFRDANHDTIENWGGLDVTASPAEFDAINAKYGLKGRKAVRSLARALWVTMPKDRPFCLDRIDIAALNETSPGQHGTGFRLPRVAYDAQADREQESYYQAQRERDVENRMRRAIDAAFDKALYKRGLKPVDDDAAPF